MKQLLFIALFICICKTTFAQTKEFKSAQVIINNIQQTAGIVWPKKTVDTFIVGNPNTKITGIATTQTATMDVLKKAVISGLNLIITHEPTFYNHLDDLKDLNGIQETKLKFIRKNDLVVWRFHDAWHTMKPDGIMTGMVQKLGWEGNQVGDQPGFFEFDKMTLSEFVSQLQKHSPTSIRVIGKPQMNFTRVAALWGATSSDLQMEILERSDVEVLVIGETREWETVEYVRDASSMGRTKALIILGHVNSEEAGMKYCAEWLKEFIFNTPIEFIEAGDPFWNPQ